MVCVEVTLDGSPFRRVGIRDASLITPTVHGFVDDEAPARLELSGVCDLGGERAAHVYWEPDDVALNDGTVVTFRLAMCEFPSPPDQVVPTDSRHTSRSNVSSRPSGSPSYPISIRRG